MAQPKDDVESGRIARRSALAAAFAAALAVPLIYPVSLGGDDGFRAGGLAPPAPEVVLPTPPGPLLEVRKVHVPGPVPADPPRVFFVDRRRGWAWYDERAMATTADGGRTWKRVLLPMLPLDASVLVYPYAPDSLALHVVAETDQLWVTVDGGATFLRYRADNPPTSMLVAQLGRYQMIVTVSSGDRTQLTRVGEGKAPHQPPLRGPNATIVNGADGRLWLSDHDMAGGNRRLMVSEDGARTWREVPCPPEAGQLKVSADGRDVWLEGRKGFFRLEGLSWREYPYADGGRLLEWEPAGAGMLALVQPRESFGFLSEAGFSAVNGIDAEHLLLLGDGTLALSARAGLILGVGVGARREWIAIY